MRRLIGVHRGVLLAVTVLACGACRRGEIAAGVSDSTFVATLADLQRIGSDPALDSAGRDSARRRVLQGRGLTVEQLDRAAAALADDPVRARELLQAVRIKLMPPAEDAERPKRADSGRRTRPAR